MKIFVNQKFCGIACHVCKIHFMKSTHSWAKDITLSFSFKYFGMLFFNKDTLLFVVVCLLTSKNVYEFEEILNKTKYVKIIFSAVSSQQYF